MDEYVKSKIADLYLSGIAAKDIAVQMDCTAETVRRVLISMGIWDPKRNFIPKQDSPEDIQKCLHCKKAKCTNCLEWSK